jgi:hypothetical protein
MNVLVSLGMLCLFVDRGDATCIICREEMSSAKKLPCGHFFHVHCLRSWLERQQTCPTCRAPVLPPDNGPAANGTDPAAHHMHPPHQDQPAAEGALFGLRTHGNEMHCEACASPCMTEC